jgi:hypothetical protein
VVRFTTYHSLFFLSRSYTGQLGPGLGALPYRFLGRSYIRVTPCPFLIVDGQTRCETWRAPGQLTQRGRGQAVLGTRGNGRVYRLLRPFFHPTKVACPDARSAPLPPPRGRSRKGAMRKALIDCLRQQRPKRRKRGGPPDKRAGIVTIHERPPKGPSLGIGRVI